MLGLILIASGALLGIFILDRFGLWAERKGWIFYRHRKPSGTAMGALVLELQQIFESGKARHVLEVQQDAKPASPDPGSGKGPGASPGPGLNSLLLPALFLSLAACSRAPQTAPRHSPVPQGLARLGYTLQAGAFARVENAARFAEVLRAQGLDATYFPSGDRLFRVRFGDFPSREQARARGETLKQAGVLEAYWVVLPDGSAPGVSGGFRVHAEDEKGLRADLVTSARGYLGVPYLFGGTSERGFDCSGYTGAVYRLNGLNLPRSSAAQAEAGRRVDLEAAQPGDLVFFATGGGHRVSHVGLYLGRGAFLHAPRPGQKIRQDDLSDRYYRETFLGARTYF